MNADSTRGVEAISPIAQMTPIPMSELQPEAEQRRQDQGDRSTSIQTDRNGQYIIDLGDDETLLYYCPCCMPFVLCCWIDQTNSVVFDDKAQTVTRVRTPGYFCCFFMSCFSTEREITAYGDVANIGLQKTSMVTSCTARDGDYAVSATQPLYYPVLIRRNRAVMHVGKWGSKGSLEQQILALHLFFFGRANASYEKPDIESLIIQM